MSAGSAYAASKTANRFINKSLYENVYPSTLNNTRQKTDETNKTTNINLQNQMTTSNSTGMSSVGKRQVIKRKTQARSATNQTTTNKRVVLPRSSTARSGVGYTRNLGRKSSASNVVARAGTNKSGSRYTKSARTTSSSYSSTSSAVSSQRCFADYKECMESYCEREDTAYNRCYCSAKLAQIDAKYQNKIDDLIQQIIRLKYDVDATDEEIKEYWDQTVGTYTGDNPWVNIDNALNINWADTESRVRGQNAFIAGHKYCVYNLKSCSSMATNMRDAYKSEIARDCEIYEKSLQRIQSAAESVIGTYND